MIAGLWIVPLGLLLPGALGWLLAGPLRRVPMSGPIERAFLYWLLGATTLSWVGSTLGALGLFRPWVFLLLLGFLLLGLHRWGQLPARGARHIEATPPLDLPPTSTPLSPPPQPAGLARGVRARAFQRIEGWLPPHAAAEPPLAAPQPLPRLATILLVLTLAGSAWLFARPAESFFLIDDSAVYTIGGVALARSGTLFAPQDAFWTISSDFARDFFELDQFGLTSRHYGPFFEWFQRRPAVEIGFLPLPKVWTAYLTWFFGPAESTWGAPLFALAGVAALFFLANRLRDWPTALVALLFLAVNVTQVWFARYPISEVYTQAAFLGGLYLALLARQEAHDQPASHLLALWSGVVLASLTILRFEGPLLLAVVAALLLAGWGLASLRQGAIGRTWLLTLGVLGGFGTLMSTGVARHYIFSQSLTAVTPGIVQAGLAGVLGLGVGVALWQAWLRHTPAAASLEGLLARLTRLLPLAIAAGWLLWGALAAWQLGSRPWGDTLAGWLAQYWSPSAILLSVVGVVALLLLAWRRPALAPELMVLCGLAVALLLAFARNTYVTPMHPWAMRRLVPMVMPALALGAATALMLLGRWRPRGAALLGPLLALVLGLGQGALIGQGTLPIVWHQENQGLWRQLEAFAATLPEDAVLVFDNGQVGERLTQVMDLVFQRPALSLRAGNQRNMFEALDTLLQATQSQQRPIFFVVTDGDIVWQPEGWRLESRGLTRLQTTILRHVPARAPMAEDVVSRDYLLDLYEIVPAEAGSRLTPLQVPLGEGSYPYLREGFHGWEPGPDALPMRWTEGNARLTLPWPGEGVESPATFCLAMQVLPGRSPEAPPAQLTVVAEGRRLAEVTLRNGYAFQPVAISSEALPNAGEHPLEIELQSTTWQAPGDPRTLGILLQGLELRPGAPCPAP